MSTLRRCEIKLHPPTTDGNCPLCRPQPAGHECDPRQTLMVLSGFVVAFELAVLVFIFWLAHR